MRLTHLKQLQEELRGSLNDKICYIHPNSGFRIFLNFVHLLAIIYSVMMILFRISLAMSTSGWFIAMECVVLTESIVYIILHFFTAQYSYGILSMVRKTQLRIFWQKGLLWELLGLIPFNIILSKSTLFSTSLIINFFTY